jgi:hypothetical protein
MATLSLRSNAATVCLKLLQAQTKGRGANSPGRSKAAGPANRVHYHLFIAEPLTEI